MENTNILFIGAGGMGTAMVNNLFKSGSNVSVFNRTYKNAIKLEKIGVTVYRDLPVVINQGIIIFMVSDDDAIDDLLFKKFELFKRLAKKSIVIQMSTLSYKKTLELKNIFENADIFFIDSPVSGAIPQAVSKDIHFFVSGILSIVNIVRPILHLMGSQIYYLGNTGNGTLMKLYNNILNAVQIIGLIEVISLVKETSLNMCDFNEIISNGSPGSPIVRAKLKYLQVPEPKEVESYLELLAKDLEYGKRLTSDVGKKQLIELASSVYNEGVVNGFGKDDVSSIHKFMC